jgi:hypothetical protein
MVAFKVIEYHAAHLQVGVDTRASDLAETSHLLGPAFAYLPEGCARRIAHGSTVGSTEDG